MLPPTLLSVLPLLLPLLPYTAAATRSPKRGLIYINNKDHPEDNAVWVQKGSSLTWYYNYRDVPSTAFAGIPQEKFEFVPMMWGVDPDDPESPAFYEKVKAMIDDGTVNVKHALSFNEPDGKVDTGGSDVTPGLAARAWVKNFEPLRELGVKVGLPACTGAPGGLPWLKEFLEKCDEFLSEGEDERRNCTYDFLPVHWYDNFEGLASHIGERTVAFPDTPIWVTEYAYAHQDLFTTQQYYNMSADYFDNSTDIERYSYFGAFRSSDSNVGTNAVFLNRDGELTDIGSWYLGGNATGVDPNSGEGAAGALRSPVALVLAVAVGAALLGL